MAGVSSSVTAAMKSPLTFRYSLFVVVAALWAMVTDSSKPLSSCCAVRVTVWGVFQLLDVNVRVFWAPGLPVSVSSTTTANVLLLVIVAVTVWVGWEVRRTV